MICGIPQVYNHLGGITQKENRNEQHSRSIAIKVMENGPFPGMDRFQRFQREARILASLKHPNIVTIYDTGVLSDHDHPIETSVEAETPFSDRFYLVMDYIDGKPLDQFVQQNHLNIRAKLKLFEKVCDTVHAAHLNGVIHRDLKPSNIQITLGKTQDATLGTDDSGGEPHLLDFGLATAITSEGDEFNSITNMTMTGQFVGSLPWASPEQAEGIPGKIDVRTDVYSLGIILYYLLTRKFPYTVVGNIRDVVDNILTVAPERPSQISQDIDDEIETIVLRCLSKERDRRYQSAGELARDIQHYLAGEPIQAKRDSQWYMLKKMLHRYRVGVGVSALFIVMLIVFGITMSILYQREQFEAQRAQRTLSFLQNTLFQASSQRLGSDATLSEVLDYASKQLFEEFPDQPAASASLHYTIGCAYETIWRKEEAVEHLRVAADMNRELYGLNHPDTQKCMVMLGMVLAEMNQPESVNIQKEVLDARLKQYGQRHFLIADSKNELAYALWSSAKPPRWNEAELLYQQAHRLYQETVDGQHPDYARSLHGYAAMKHTQGLFDQAAEHYRMSLELSRSLLGEDHQFVLECMRDYAETLKELGQYDEAEQFLQQVLAKTPRLFGRSWTPNIVRRMASVQRRRGHLAEAEKTYKESVAMQCEYLADKHPDQKITLLSYAQTMRALSSPVDASKLRDIFLMIYELTGQPIDTARSLVSIAGVTRQQYGHAAAAPLVIEAIHILQLDPEKSGWYLGYAKGALGRYYVALERYTEAKPLLLEGFDILKTHLSEDHPYTIEVVEALKDMKKKSYNRKNKKNSTIIPPPSE